MNATTCAQRRPRRRDYSLRGVIDPTGTTGSGGASGFKSSRRSGRRVARLGDGMAQSHARVLQNAQAVRVALGAVFSRFDDLVRSIERQVEAESLPAEPADARPEPSLDRASYSVVWRGRTCHLRNGLPFRLMEALASRRRQYVTIEELLATVWGEDRSRTAVRSVVWELRKLLIAGGMEDLARMIDGSCRGHYRLAVPVGR